MPQFSDPLGDLLAARVPVIQLQRGAVTAVGAASPRVLLPGSFNPVHDGHSQLLEAACAAVGGGATGGFELSVTNADKGTLPRGEVERRAMQFAAGGHALVLTDAPLFVQKAALLPGTVFVVGVDTAVRIVMPKYYGGSEAAMLEVLHTIRRHNCSFLVAGRLVDGAFVEPTSVAAPPGLEGVWCFWWAIRTMFTLCPDASPHLSHFEQACSGRCPPSGKTSRPQSSVRGLHKRGANDRKGN